MTLFLQEENLYSAGTMQLNYQPGENGVTSSRNEEVFPPEFNDEWTMPRTGRRRPTADRGANDFPDVGEMPIPNVSPMSAHVSPHGELLSRSITSLFFDISAVSSMQWNRGEQIPTRRVRLFSNSWSVQKHDTFVTFRF